MRTPSSYPVELLEYKPKEALGNDPMFESTDEHESCKLHSNPVAETYFHFQGTRIRESRRTHTFGGSERSADGPGIIDVGRNRSIRPPNASRRSRVIDRPASWCSMSASLARFATMPSLAPHCRSDRRAPEDLLSDLPLTLSRHDAAWVSRFADTVDTEGGDSWHVFVGQRTAALEQIKAWNTFWRARSGAVQHT